MISIKNFNKYYNKKTPNEIHVINNTTLSFNDTGLVCILGESGSGKTTLMNAIGGLDTFNSGELKVNDLVIEKYNSKIIDKVRNENFGYVFQNYYLLQDRTVYYNIELALNMYELTPKEKEERILYVLKAVGMEKYRKRNVNQLSGGQQQRVAIARALAKTPNVIFADEPTGNLDEKNTIQIMNIIKKLSEECLIILVTHERRIAEFYADRIIKIEDGTVVEDNEGLKDAQYEYEDNNNIYLKEYKNVDKLEKNNLQIDYYHDDSNKIDLKIISKNGYVYIQSSNPELKVEYLDPQDEKKIIDDYKPVINQDDIKSFKYDLPRLEPKKAPRLTFKETVKMALGNLKMSKKKNIFMYIALIFTAMISMVCVSSLISVTNFNELKIATNSKKTLRVDVLPGSTAGNSPVREEYLRKLISYETKEDDIKVWPTLGQTLQVVTDTYMQLDNVKMILDVNSILDINLTSKDELIAGTMPQGPLDIVLDKSIVDHILDSSSVLSNYFNNYQSFVGTYLRNKYNTMQYHVSGIVDSNDITAYGSVGIAASSTGLFDNICTLETLQKTYPGKYDNITIRDDYVMLRDDLYKDNKMRDDIILGNRSTLNIENDNLIPNEDKIPVSFPFKFIVNDKTMNSYIINTAAFLNRAIFVTENKAKFNNLFEKFVTENPTPDVVYEIHDAFEEQLEEYRYEKKTILFYSGTIGGAILIVTLIVLFFTMKANAIKRIYDIGVYRSIGITKGSIYLAMVIETFLISCLTTLISSLVTYGVVQLVCNIPFINFDLGFSPLSCFITILSLFILNIGIGILPMIRLLNMPPAKLTAKYDL